MALRKIARIHRNYRKVTIYVGHAKTGQWVNTFTSTPNPGQTRKERYDAICVAFTNNGLIPPPYDPSPAERRAAIRRLKR